MEEDILGTGVRLDEAEALVVADGLDGSLCHAAVLLAPSRIRSVAGIVPGLSPHGRNHQRFRRHRRHRRGIALTLSRRSLVVMRGGVSSQVTPACVREPSLHCT